MNLIEKYNVPVPRYTSYPTVPAWTNNLTVEKWQQKVKQAFDVSNDKDGISIYIHLPFCESLCTYCACNTRITINHKVEEPYIDALLKEWNNYLNVFGSAPRIKELHLGGGTPTFFKADNLKKLIEGILLNSTVCNEADLSFEAHPSNTTREHLQTLFDLGFKRVSFGIQDFDIVVQEAINRYQTFEEVDYIVKSARLIGYTSINFDLVYGLPFQNLNGLKNTIRKILTIRPERIAFYSYAHVPWVKPGQRKFTEKDLPVGENKKQLYETGRELLLTEGAYRQIGMDHFALESDDLYKAAMNKTLHRNFMGYTPNYTRLLVGLGVSSISDTGDAFAQNIKTVEGYHECLNADKWPVSKGHILSLEDLFIRRVILNIMCHFETTWNDHALSHKAFRDGLKRLEQLEADGLVELHGSYLRVTEKGRPFLRNICLCFDEHYWNSIKAKDTFSSAV
jgi:oxygen-independent coproporphyrinogen III oxidase